MIADTLLTKYRPRNLDAVIGHEAAVTSLKRALAEGKARAFLFTGPAGVGKTTLARICARQFGCGDADVVEIDAATNTGIDSMRALTETLGYRSFGDSGKKALIVDEAHRLSAAAFTATLKSVEDAPAHVMWLFCSTDPGKIPAAIRSRCVAYDLKPLRAEDLRELLEFVDEEECYRTGKDVLTLVAREADGSPRQALAMLAACAGRGSAKDAQPLISSVSDSAQAIDLCRLLAKPRIEWSELMACVDRMEEPNVEGVRLVVLAYFAKVARSAKSGEQAKRALRVMSCFDKPYNPSEKLAPLILSLGDVAYSS